MGFWGFGVFGFFGFLDFWVFGFLGFWVFGFLGFWVFGFLGLWVFGEGVGLLRGFNALSPCALLNFEEGGVFQGMLEIDPSSPSPLRSPAKRWKHRVGNQVVLVVEQVTFNLFGVV